MALTRKADGTYEGVWWYAGTSKPTHAPHVDGELVKGRDRQIILGSWREEGDEYTWWMELSADED